MGSPRERVCVRYSLDVLDAGFLNNANSLIPSRGVGKLTPARGILDLAQS